MTKDKNVFESSASFMKYQKLGGDDDEAGDDENH